jgi:cell division transport system permease protein
MIRTKRIFHFAGQNFIRNAWLSVVTLTILVIMLLAVNLMVSVNFAKNELLKNAQTKINVTVNFKPVATEQDVNKLADELHVSDNVTSVTIVTPDQHLENFKRLFPNLKDTVSVLNENPLGYQLQVRADDAQKYQAIIDQIDSSSSASLVESQTLYDYRDFLASAEKTIDQFNTFGLIIALIFLLLAIVVVFNTIRVSVYTQREEVGIMKLVGATNWFVRAPFLLETVFYALAATMVTFLITYATLRFTNVINFQIVDGVRLNLEGYYTSNFWILFLSQFAGIALINIIATTVALRRYLKV